MKRPFWKMVETALKTTTVVSEFASTQPSAGAPVELGDMDFAQLVEKFAILAEPTCCFIPVAEFGRPSKLAERGDA